MTTLCPDRFRWLFPRLTVLLLALASGVAVGCDSGSSTPAEAVDDGSGGDGDADGSGDGTGTARPAPQVVGLQVGDVRQTPAQISFDLIDESGEPVAVRLFYAVGSDALPVTGGELELEGSAEAVRHTFEWDFVAEDNLDGSLKRGVTVFAVAGEGEVEAIEGENAALVDLGNDAPFFLDADGDGFADGSAPSDEVAGALEVTVLLADSSADATSVGAFFAIASGLDLAGGERPEDGAYQPATGVEPLPESVTTTAEGVELTFRWNVASDLPGVEELAVLRFSADDGLGSAFSPITPLLRVDNNLAPTIDVDDAAFFADPDGRRGVAIPYETADPESDDLDVVFQWRRPGESFPPLPIDADGLRQILQDPVERRALRIATPFPASVQGDVDLVNPSRVRLVGLKGAEGHATTGGLEGRTLSILRPDGALADATVRWSSNSLMAPRAIARASGIDPVDVLVLEQPSATEWRLRALQLDSGAAQPVAAGAQGQPTAMTIAGPSTVLVAVVDGSAWSVLEVSLPSGNVVPFVPTALPPRAGAVHGLVVLGDAATLVSVDDSILRLDHADPAATVVTTLVTGLSGPRGMAFDPALGRVIVAERDANRLVALDCSTGALEDLSSISGLVRPDSLAALPGGGLAVTCDADAGDGVGELHVVTLGGGAGFSSALVADELPGSLGQVSVASDGRWFLALPDVNGLRERGGIDQRRTIVDHALGSEFVDLDQQLSTPLPDGARWSLTIHGESTSASPGGVERLFSWDTSDVVGGGEVFVRATAVDGDLGASDETATAGKVLKSSFDTTRASVGNGIATLADGLRVADVNGDGRFDLIGAALSAGTEIDSLQILYQDELNGFGEPEFLLDPDELAPDHVRVADLTGNGLADIAYASDINNAILIHTQEPGGFGAVVAIDEVELVLPSLSIGDVNADGRADLVVTSEGNKVFGVVVFFQPPNGFGSDDPLVTQVLDVSNGASPTRTVLADVDGDGALDIGVPNGDAGNAALVLFRDLGSDPATFTEVPLAIPESLDPEAEGALETLVFTDLDGDGDLDAAVGSAELGIVLVFHQVAPRSFEVAGDPLSVADLDVRSLQATDLDGDGLSDLLVGGDGQAPLAFLQNGLGSFRAGVELDAGNVSSTSLAIGDLDADGGPEIVLAGDGAFVVLQNIAPRGLGAPERLALGQAGSPVALAVADFDGDGDLDVVSGEQSIELFEQTAPNSFAAPVASSPLDGAVHDVAPADIDGDGALDVIALTDQRVELLSFVSPSFSTLGDIDLVGADEPFRVLVADLDASGGIDVVVADRGTGQLSVHLRKGGGFEASQVLTMPGGFLEAAALADVDGDDRPDLIGAGGAPGEVAVFRNEGGTFVLLGSPVALADEVLALAAGDIDGDGDVDLVTGGSESRFTLLRQQAGGVIAAPVTLPAGAEEIVRLSLSDVDGDRRLDLVAGVAGATKVYYQDAVGGFTRIETLSQEPGDDPVAHLVVDVDGDGELDIATVNMGAGDVALHSR